MSNSFGSFGSSGPVQAMQKSSSLQMGHLRAFGAFPPDAEAGESMPRAARTKRRLLRRRRVFAPHEEASSPSKTRLRTPESRVVLPTLVVHCFQRAVQQARLPTWLPRPPVTPPFLSCIVLTCIGGGGPPRFRHPGRVGRRGQQPAGRRVGWSATNSLSAGAGGNRAFFPMYRCAFSP